MLIVFGGLPGAGKTTLARSIARERRAVYLRIDTIEDVLLAGGASADDVGPMGYEVAYALASEHLDTNVDVVADCVNPLGVTRAAWRRIAVEAGTPIAEIEVVCSDRAEHRRRVESRSSDPVAPRSLTWQTVIDRPYEPYDRPHIAIDTFCTPSQALDRLRGKIASFENARTSNDIDAVRTFSIVARGFATFAFVTGLTDLVGAAAPLPMLGADLSDEALRDPVLNSQIAYLGAVWCGYGLAL